jgi:hypothetical protein
MLFAFYINYHEEIFDGHKVLVGARTQAAQGSKALSRHWQALAEIRPRESPVPHAHIP